MALPQQASSELRVPLADAVGHTLLSRAVGWSWAAFGVVGLAYLFAPHGMRFPAAVLSAFAFAAAQWWWPECRPVPTAPLCPWNWALGVFFVRVVVMPVSVMIWGPTLGTLPSLPS